MATGTSTQPVAKYISAKEHRAIATDKLELARDAIRLAGMHIASIASADAQALARSCEEMGRELRTLAKRVR